MTRDTSWTLEVRETNGTATGPAMPLELEEPGHWTFGRDESCDVELGGQGVSGVHFSLTLDAATRAVTLQDMDSTNGTTLDGRQVTGPTPVIPGQSIALPGWRLTLIALPRKALRTAPRKAPTTDFPTDILSGELVDPAALHAGPYPVSESRFCAIGGGIGSFVFVDHLRCFGVPAGAITVIGTDPVCYETYRRYCRNSQIPDHERLRSNSLSTPDNIWGFPGYASRESLGGLKRGRIGALKYVFQVFGEPTLAESYTPRAGDVFASLDREAARIGWSAMFRQGQALRIRKTTDGRYAVAWRMRGDGAAEMRDRIVIAEVLHLSTGYAATRFVEDFQDFITHHPDRRHMVHNAYEAHDQIFTAAEQTSAPVHFVVRGRGIVASREIQRLAEARRRNPNIVILHSMRSRLDPRGGAKYGRASRPVRINVEIQPFNWPKACWGGDLRFEYERAGPEKRGAMLATLGGTTTAQRSDWIEIAERGEEEGWYRPVYGAITEIQPETDRDGVMIRIKGADGHVAELHADHLIDCTGLISDITRSAPLGDLITTYGLPRNHAYRRQGEGWQKAGPTGLEVSNSFEVAAMRNGPGRIFAAGTITSGGPYLAVDSFLGLQYAALRATDQLAGEGQHGVPRMGPLGSVAQWLKWCTGTAPR